MSSKQSNDEDCDPHATCAPDARCYCGPADYDYLQVALNDTETRKKMLEQLKDEIDNDCVELLTFLKDSKEPQLKSGKDIDISFDFSDTQKNKPKV